MDVDEILRSLNKFGRYQVFQLVYNFLCLPILTYPVVIYVFIGEYCAFVKKCKVFFRIFSLYMNFIAKCSEMQNYMYEFFDNCF